MLTAKSSKFAVLLFSLTLVFLLHGALASAADVGPGESIQGAIDAAQSGDTITVEPDTYNEKLSIGKSLTITSTGSASETVINASGLGGAAVSVSADDVTIDGFTIQQADGDGLSASDVSGLVLKNNIFLANGQENHGDGVQVKNVSNATIESNTFDDNSSHGLFSVSSSGLSIQENTLKNHTNFSAVLLFSTVDSDIQSNLVESNITGIAVGQWQDSDSPSSNVSITGNTVQNNTEPVSNYSGFGIWISADDITVRRNTVTGNTKGMFVFDKTFTSLEASASSSGVVAENFAPENSLFNQADIAEVTDSAAVTSLESSSAYPAAAPSASNIKIQENIMEGNSTLGLENQASNQVSGVFNWWGAESGPSYDGPGSGDEVSGAVSYNPWLETTGNSPAPLGVYEVGISNFKLRTKNSADTVDLSFAYGIPTWAPIAGDWDGDGKDTVGIYGPTTATFYLRNSNSAGLGEVVLNYGMPNWVPLAGDWDGDGKDTVGAYAPNTGTFFLKNTNEPGSADIMVNFGSPNWVPVVGDWDGDGQDTLGVYKPSSATFFLKDSHEPGGADITVRFGAPNWEPLAEDWNGDGKDTIGAYNPANGTFYLNNQNTPGHADIAIQYGGTDKKPITGNWGTSGMASTSNTLRKQVFNGFAMGDVIASPNPVSVDSDEVTFKATGEDVQEVQVSVFNPGGTPLFSSDVVTGNTVTWNPLKEGSLISNGLYLYRIEARGPDGSTSSKVGKLMVIR